jgi:hypothetical protein
MMLSKIRVKVLLIFNYTNISTYKLKKNDFFFEVNHKSPPHNVINSISKYALFCYEYAIYISLGLPGH